MMRHVTAVALLCALFATGCESRPYGLAPVSGVVTLDGKPVPGSSVSFQPQGTSTNPGPGSVGKCDESGRYELETIRREPGAVPGPHAVRIYSPKKAVVGESAPPEKELFPPKYNFQTELTFTVPEEGTTAADFKLTTK
jgi:hypothetical protein